MNEEDTVFVVLDEVGSDLKTHLGKTWAKKGCTPYIRTTLKHTDLMVLGAMTFTGHIYAHFHTKSVTAVAVIRFLKHLKTQIKKDIVVLMDHARIHTAKVITEFLAKPEGEKITIFYSPPYAPEFNAIEWLWSWVKRTRLSNLTFQTMEDLKRAWRIAINYVRSKTELIYSFFKASSLSDLF